MAKANLKVVENANSNPVANPITKQRVMEIVRLKALVEDAKNRLAEAEAKLEPVEDAMVTDLQFGAKNESGIPVAVGDTARRNVSWKNEFIRVESKAEAEKILAATPLSHSFYIIVNI